MAGGGGGADTQVNRMRPLGSGVGVDLPFYSCTL